MIINDQLGYNIAMNAALRREQLGATRPSASTHLAVYGRLSIAGQHISEAAGQWLSAHALAPYAGARQAITHAEEALADAERQAQSVLDVIAEHRAAEARRRAAAADAEREHTATAAACLEE